MRKNLLRQLNPNADLLDRLDILEVSMDDVVAVLKCIHPKYDIQVHVDSFLSDGVTGLKNPNDLDLEFVPSDFVVVGSVKSYDLLKTSRVEYFDSHLTVGGVEIQYASLLGFNAVGGFEIVHFPTRMDIAIQKKLDLAKQVVETYNDIDFGNPQAFKQYSIQMVNSAKTLLDHVSLLETIIQDVHDGIDSFIKEKKKERKEKYLTFKKPKN